MNANFNRYNISFLVIFLLAGLARYTALAEDSIPVDPQQAGLKEAAYDFPKPKNGNTYVIAHRGAHIGIPENSMAAYQKAIDLGCDFVEIDVRKTKDGKLVSVHNSTVDKYVKGVTGKVSDFTLEELKAMDIGHDHGAEWKNTRIPILDEIFKLCRGQIGIYLDLKEPHIEELVAMIKKYEMERDVFWCIPADSKEGIERLKKVKSLCYKCVPMPDPGNEKNIESVIEQIQPRVLAPVMSDFSENYVKIAHAKNVKVFVDEKRGTEKEWTHILDYGTDGIQTNDPERLIRFLKEREKHSNSY